MQFGLQRAAAFISFWSSIHLFINEGTASISIEIRSRRDARDLSSASGEKPYRVFINRLSVCSGSWQAESSSYPVGKSLRSVSMDVELIASVRWLVQLGLSDGADSRRVEPTPPYCAPAPQVCSSSSAYCQPRSSAA